MSYYNVLSAASTLLLQQHFTMRRCRRRFNGPHRYVLFDTHGHAIHFDAAEKSRRMGYTLQELLAWLTIQPHPSVAAAARALMQELEDWHQIKTAS